MSEVKAESKTKRTHGQDSSNPEQSRRRYGYGLGHFLKFKQSYSPMVDKEGTHSFERGYN